jgi:hypothetical protein
MLLLALVAIVAIIIIWSMRTEPLATSNAVTITAVGYTNPPGDSLRFALFSISNQTPYSIRWHGDWVEVEGRADHKGRTINPNLPGYTYGPVLKKGEALTLAVGEPFYSSEVGRWRLAMSFSRYTTREWWYFFAPRHKLPLQLGPLVLVDGQRVLDPSNHVTTSSSWLTKDHDK